MSTSMISASEEQKTTNTTTATATATADTTTTTTNDFTHKRHHSYAFSISSLFSFTKSPLAKGSKIPSKALGPTGSKFNTQHFLSSTDNLPKIATNEAQVSRAATEILGKSRLDYARARSNSNNGSDVANKAIEDEAIGVITDMTPQLQINLKKSPASSKSSLKNHGRSKSHSFSATSSSTHNRMKMPKPTEYDYLSRVHPVQKVLQQDTWDCGLATVCMVLRAFGYTTCTLRELTGRCPTSSVWSIDLAYLLRHYIDADFTYYTMYWGSNPDYKKLKFYQMEYNEDTERVSKLFARASQEGIRILQIFLTMVDLKRFMVAREFVAILLVDVYHLRCELCSSQSHTSATKSLLRMFQRQEYAGHFVLVYAYISSKDEFLIRDPAMTDEYCIVKASVLEQARTRPGTDNDCIIIKL
ncbi:hypothetical protein H4219_001675 [Mycoemilia scoparia]|uniref:Guanylyl cyclase n=1 Tax=Mycoemilia scoparia TaxID=417184 RepID=A0A9W7ZZR4_9FUNG|nr:hypothetical protein H4219_001675 [Mycoemilia scoparia]